MLRNCDSVKAWITGSFAFGVGCSGKWSRTSGDALDLFANRVALAGHQLSTQSQGSAFLGTETSGRIGVPRLMKTGYLTCLGKGRVDTAIASIRRTSNLRRNNGY